MLDEHNNKHTEACSSLFFVVFLRVNCSICAGLLTVHIFINEIWTKLCDDTNCTVKMIIIWGYLVFISMDYHSSGLSYCEPPLGIAHELHRSNCFLYKKIYVLFAQRTDNAGSFSRWMAAHIFSLLSNMLKLQYLMKSFHVDLEVSFQLEVVNQE